MRTKFLDTTTAALLATTALASPGLISAAHAQAVPNTTVSNDNILNLLSPFLGLNATTVGQQTLSTNLAQAIATNNNATPALMALSVSDKNLFGGRVNTITLANGQTATYGVAANLAGGLPAQAAVNPSAGAVTTTATTPIQSVGGLGAVLGPIFQTGVAPTTNSNATASAILANTATLLNTAYTNFTSADLGVAKFYFANGTTNGSATAVAATGQTLPTANGLPNTTNSVYDLAYGVKNTQSGQDVYGSSRPVQVAPMATASASGINQFDSTSISGLTTNPSFPSGHTTYAYTDSILIGMLVPQDYQNMLLRASAYANSRIVLGVHYPLDIIASRALASYDLSQAFTNAAYGTTATASQFNLSTLYNNARPEIQNYLTAQGAAAGCGATIAACSTSAANTANDPYVPSTANAATYQANLTYGLPTLTFAQAPQEAAPANGPDASILLAPLYGGSTAAATTIAPNGGIDGSLSTATINQIIVNTENNALAAFYGTSLSYWTRINLYAAAGYFNGVTGTLSLATTDVVTQNVTVASGGVLADNGRITGQSTVASGGTLAGSGTAGAVTVQSGGTLAPGSLAAQAALAAGQTGVTGTALASTGAVAFAPGATFGVYATRTQVTSLTTTGTAAPNGATVNVTLPTSGQFVTTQNNRILTAIGGVTGAFSNVTSNLLFATPTLSYDANDAYVSFGGPNFAAGAGTRNQTNVANALTRVAAANPNAAFLNGLETLTTGQGAQAAAIFDSLSGEGITAAQNVAHRSASLFTSSIMDQTTFFAGASNSITLSDQTGRPPIRELADLPAHAPAPVPVFAAPRTWRAWATGFGGTETIDGRAGVGSAGQSYDIYGGSLGVDYQLTPNYLLGVAVGGTDGEFNVPGRLTSGSTTGGHVAFYDLATFGAFYGASTASFSYFNNRTTRTVAGFGGVGGETDRGNFDSHEFRTRLEVGRHFGTLGGVVTPFVALEIAQFRSNGFSETNLGGPTLLGLNVSGQSSASVPSFVGARYQGAITLGNGMVLSPSLQAAWVHEFAPQRNQIGSFVSLPGSTFLVNGAQPARNAAQIKAGGEIAVSPNSILFASFDTELSGVAQFYGGKAGLKFVW